MVPARAELFGSVCSSWNFIRHKSTNCRAYLCHMYTAELIFEHFPELTQKQKEQFERLGPLYEEWNAKINVISRKDMESFYLKHVLHSLGIAKVYDFLPGQVVLDVGTGGGFPGIPLAILFPETEFHWSIPLVRRSKLSMRSQRRLDWRMWKARMFALRN